MNAWKMFVPVAAIATLAMVPQDPKPADAAPPPAATTSPAPAEQVAAVSISEMHYLPLHATERVVVPAKNVVEIRLIELGTHLRLELSYENGDYSLVEAQAFHLLRNTGQSARPVRLVRGPADGMRFPRGLVQ